MTAHAYLTGNLLGIAGDSTWPGFMGGPTKPQIQRMGHRRVARIHRIPESRPARPPPADLGARDYPSCWLVDRLLGGPVRTLLRLFLEDAAPVPGARRRDNYPRVRR